MLLPNLQSVCRSSVAEGLNKANFVALLASLICLVVVQARTQSSHAAQVDEFPSVGYVLSYEQRQKYALGRVKDIACTLRLHGDIEDGDEARLARLLDKVGLGNGSVLCLDSLGGSYSEGLKIAEMILRRRSIATAVPRNARCFSACAIIFLSGSMDGEEGNIWQVRWLHAQGQLGFHAPYLPGGVVADEVQAQKLFLAGITSVRRLMKLGKDIVGRTNMKRQIPQDLVLEMLEKGPGELFMIDTIQKASEYYIDLVGVAVPTKVTARMLCNACQNYHLRHSDDKDLGGSGDCSPQEVAEVVRKRRQFDFRGSSYVVLDFGNFGAEGASYCSVAAKASESGATDAWGFLSTDSGGVPPLNGETIIPMALSEQCVGLAAIGAHPSTPIRREALPWSTANFSSGSMNW